MKILNSISAVLLSVFVFVLSASVADAATYYVSATSTNGYGVGSNSYTTTQAQNKATPWLTPEYALTTMASGDTIILNDGTYNLTSFLNIDRSGTWTAENDLMVTLRTGTSTARVINLIGANLNLTLNGIILDANNITQYNISTHATAYSGNITLNGVKLLNPTLSFLNIPAAVTNLTINDSIAQGATTTRNGISMLTLASSTVMIDGLDITQSGHSQTGTGLISIYATSSSVDVTIRDVVGVLTPDQSLISSVRHTGISVINVADVLIEDSDITINNGPNSQISDTISINSSAPQLLDSSGAIIRNNIVRNNTSGGHIILVGEDGSSTSSATEDTSNNARIYGNTVIGSANSTTVHGIMLGNQTGGEVYNNIVENTYIAYLGKGQNGANFHHNVDVNIYGHSLRSKASADMVFYNNTIILPGDSTEIGLYANHDDVTNIYSEDIIFDNNLVYALDDISAFSVIDATSTATFNNNSYYATNPQDFIYEGVTYDIAGWRNNFESNLQSSDPLISDIDGADYTLQDYSPNIDAGTSTGYLSATETDYDGNPVYGRPDIGAYEYQPTLEIGDNDINAGGDVRIYGDGKFRYLSAPVGVAMTDLTVTPVGGFASYSSTATRPEWMNISDITWNVNGVKSWTASSSVATSTIYAVGDLTPGSDYEIKVDGYESSYISGNNCVNGVCAADDDGKIAFTYSGGYSTHTFSVTEQVEVSSGGSSGSRRRVVATTNTTTSTSTKQVIVNSPAGKYSFVRDLKITMYGQDVVELQKFLNTHGYVLAATGPGSVGNETNYFGALTQNALIKFQRANGITPAMGYFGPITRAFISSHY